MESRNEPTGRRYALPEFPLDGLTILDIGCNTGSAYEHTRFRNAKALHGADVDIKAISEGREKFPHLHLKVAAAENLPYEDGSFDCVIARFSFPYTYIPRALSEAFRVLNPEGRVFLGMHDWRHHISFARASIGSPKRLLDLIYVTVASLLLSATGWCINKPWTGGYETFQTKGRMARLMKEAGFIDVSHERWEHHSIFQGRKPR
jgi:ubiquinone/menaquinone biosynthesis C-methylase UbiE